LTASFVNADSRENDLNTVVKRLLSFAALLLFAIPLDSRAVDIVPSLISLEEGGRADIEFHIHQSDWAPIDDESLEECRFEFDGGEFDFYFWARFTAFDGSATFGSDGDLEIYVEGAPFVNNGDIFIYCHSPGEAFEQIIGSDGLVEIRAVEDELVEGEESAMLQFDNLSTGASSMATVTVSDFSTLPPCSLGSLSCGSVVTEDLNSQDCQSGPLGSGHYARSYSLEMVQGDTVWLEASWAFDGYLLIEGPNGLTVAENDNYSSPADSKIEFTATHSGVHKVWATSFTPDTKGSYRLELTCEAGEGPNLAVDRPQIESLNLIPGQEIELSARVHNEGDSPSDSSNLRWLLSTDDIISLADAEIELGRLAGLSAGENRLERIALVAPGSSGNFYIGVCIDPVANESWTSNNCSEGRLVRVAEQTACASVAMECGANIDGALSTMDCSSSPRGAGFFAREYTIRAEAGTTLSISAQWRDFDGFLYLAGPGGLVLEQNDDEFDAADSLLQSILPQDGTYRAWATSFHRGATGAFKMQLDCGPVSSPDLVARVRLAGASAVTVGEQITLEHDVRNQGNSMSDATTVAIYQSNDPVISPLDDLLERTEIGPLEAGESTSFQSGLTAPEVPGNYWLGACVEAVDGESLTNNNCSVLAQTEERKTARSGQKTQADDASGALITVSSGAACPDTVISCGESAAGSLQSTDCDQGPRGRGFYTDRFVFDGSAGEVLSVESVWNGVDGYLYLEDPGGQVVAENDDFEAGGKSRIEHVLPESGTYTLWPTGFSKGAGGAYELELACDQGTAPDLTADDPVLSSASARAGQNIDISTRVHNSGAGPSQATVLHYFLSDSMTLSQDDIELGRSDVAGLGSGAASAERISATLPSTAGTYFVSVCVAFDAAEQVTSNNCSAGAKITIESNNFPIPINAGMNDAWFDLATNGQGFFINVFPNSNNIFLAWFTFDLERPPSNVQFNLGDPGHRWRTAFGTYDRGKAELEIELTQGGLFDAAPPDPWQSADGTIGLQFSDCNHGTITYDIPSVDRQGVIPIQRIAPDNAPVCEGLIGPVQSTAPTAGSPGLNDGWWDPAKGGQGFFVNVFPQSSQMFLAWFTYDTERPAANVPFLLEEPGHRWLTAFGGVADDHAQMLIEVTSGGEFVSGTPVTQTVDGTATAKFDNCNAGTLTYTIPSIDRQGEVPIERLARDTVPLCEVAERDDQDAGTFLTPRDKSVVANLCQGKLIWDFDWPDEGNGSVYQIQIRSANALEPTVDEVTNVSAFHLEKAESIAAHELKGWRWRYRLLWNPASKFLIKDWSELEEHVFDVRPMSDPCID
jgi:hypothetical protein